MANPAARLRANAQSRWPGATISARGRRFIEHAHPTDPDKKMFDTSIGPIHYGAGADQEIDTAWQATTGAWDYEMTQADYQAFARDTFNVGDLIQYTHPASGEWVLFDPQSIGWFNQDYSQHQIATKQAVVAMVNDDTLLFADAYGSGRHWQFRCEAGRLQKLLTLDSAATLPTPTITGTIHLVIEFSLRMSSGLSLWLDGVEWTKPNGIRVKTANSIECKNNQGATLFWIRPPRAWDSNTDPITHTEITGELEVRRQGGPTNLFITVRIPKTWIDTTVFPVFIDPTVDEDIASTNDDAAEQQNNSNFSTTHNYLYCEAANSTPDRWINGTHFSTVSVPNAATIDTAYWEAYVSPFWNDFLDHIYAEDVDDAVDFATDADVQSRTKTTANVALSGTPSTSTFFGSSVEIKTVIQEIVDRGGWASGQDMVILVAGDSGGGTHVGRCMDYTGDSTNTANLHIEYTAAAGRTTKNTDSNPLGIHTGMAWRINQP